MTDTFAADARKLAGDHGWNCSPEDTDVGITCDCGVNNLAAAIENALFEASKSPDCYGHQQAVDKAALAAAHREGRESGRKDTLRALQVTLDGLGAPPDEWPCNRIKPLVAAARREGAESVRKALVNVDAKRDYDKKYPNRPPSKVVFKICGCMHWKDSRTPEQWTALTGEEAT